jgi:Tol biopolymer transport system component
MDDGGGNPHVLVSDGFSDAEPTWSPDGKRIAYRSDRSGNEDIWVVDASGIGVPEPLTTDSFSERRPIW